MATEHTVADDIVYDLISIQYHALKSADVHDKYIDDAHEHDDVAAFIRAIKEQDEQRALRAHELLRDLTIPHTVGDVAATGHTTGGDFTGGGGTGGGSDIGSDAAGGGGHIEGGSPGVAGATPPADITGGTSPGPLGEGAGEAAGAGGDEGPR